MAIIRLSTEEVFGVDSQEYEILTNAVEQIKGVPGAICEIGTRRGGSAKMVIDALVENADTNRAMFCIDPYGNIEIECTNLNMSVHYPGTKVEGDPTSKEITAPYRFDYTNDMRNRTIPSLYYYAYQAGLDFTFFCLEDFEFFNRYETGVPVYNQAKNLVNEYALIFYDGPHDDKSLVRETNFFVPRSPIGSIHVFDDIWMYNHKNIEDYLFSNGFETLEKKEIKASYKKVK